MQFSEVVWTRLTMAMGIVGLGCVYTLYYVMTLLKPTVNVIKN